MLKSVRSFDTHGNQRDGYSLRAFIIAAPVNSIITIVVQDEGSRFWRVATDAIKAIGGTRTYIDFRGSYALLGYKGNSNVNWITEVSNLRKRGPSVIRKTIQLGNIKPPLTPAPVTKGPTPPIPPQGKHD